MMNLQGFLFAVGISTLALGCASQPRTPVNSSVEAQFKSADANKDGKLSQKEYGYTMLEEVFARYDTDKSGTITLKEFVALGGSPETFQKIDVNRNGTITIEEARSAPIALDPVNVAFYGADVNKDGSVTLGEAIAYRQKVGAYTR